MLLDVLTKILMIHLRIPLVIFTTRTYCCLMFLPPPGLTSSFLHRCFLVSQFQCIKWHGVALPTQDFTFPFGELHDSSVSPFLWFVDVPVNCSPALQYLTGFPSLVLSADLLRALTLTYHLGH